MRLMFVVEWLGGIELCVIRLFEGYVDLEVWLVEDVVVVFEFWRSFVYFLMFFCLESRMFFKKIFNGWLFLVSCNVWLYILIVLVLNLRLNCNIFVRLWDCLILLCWVIGMLFSVMILLLINFVCLKDFFVLFVNFLVNIFCYIFFMINDVCEYWVMLVYLCLRILFRWLMIVCVFNLFFLV